MAGNRLDPQRVRYIVVHCSASPPSVKVDAKVIDRWHRMRGFLGIGYHFVITRAGEVQPGRPLTKVGAHVSGFNAYSWGICLVGGVDEQGKSVANFTDQQYAALAQLIITLRSQLPQKVTVQGHRDFPNVAKDCPCFDVKKWVADTIDK